jgi:hypothetical protein
MLLGQPALLDHSAHCAIEQDDALAKQCFQWVKIVRHIGRKLNAVFARDQGTN